VSCPPTLKVTTLSRPVLTSQIIEFVPSVSSLILQTLEDYSGSDDELVNNTVRTNSACWLSACNTTNTVYSASSNWQDVYTSFNTNSSSYLTNATADARYVNISGDTMVGNLSVPTISTGTLYVGASTVYFIDNVGNILERLNAADVAKFRSNFTDIYPASAIWNDTYTTVLANSSIWQLSAVPFDPASPGPIGVDTPDVAVFDTVEIVNNIEVLGNILSTRSSGLACVGYTTNVVAGVYGGFDGTNILGSYFQLFGTAHPGTGFTPPGGGEFIINSTNGPTKFVVGDFNGSTYANRFTVTSDGNVGIGIADPAHALDVDGTIVATGGNSTQWNNTFNTVTNNSATWSEVPPLSTVMWNNTYTTVNTNSASWLYTSSPNITANNITTELGNPLTISTSDGNNNITINPAGDGMILVKDMARFGGMSQRSDIRFSGDRMYFTGDGHTGVWYGAQKELGLASSVWGEDNQYYLGRPNDKRWKQILLGELGMRLGDGTYGPSITANGVAPNEDLVITPGVSANTLINSPVIVTGPIYAPNGNSVQWNNSYNTVLSNSASWAGSGTETDPIFTAWAQANSANFYTVNGGQLYGPLSTLSTLSALSANFNAIQFANGGAPERKEGIVFYDNSSHTLSYYNEIPGVTINLGQEEVARMCNNTGSTIANGRVVYLQGFGFGIALPSVALADASYTASAASVVFGVTTSSIMGDGTDVGYVTKRGIVHSINVGTSEFIEGDVLYLSTTPGMLTNIPPTKPNHIVRVGMVVATGGSSPNNLIDLFVDIDEHDTLNELHNVILTNPVDANILRYNSLSGGYWYNATTSAWDEVSTVFGNQSANNISVYTTVLTNSASWDNSMLGTMSLQNANSAYITGGGVYNLSALSLSSSGTLTGMGALSVTRLRLGTSAADGILLTNTISAGNAAQQTSPALHFSGQGYKSTAPATSMPVDWRIYDLPIQGAAAPTGKLMIDSSVNNSAFSNVIQIRSDVDYNKPWIATQSGAVGFGAGNGGLMQFIVNTGERMVLSDNGLPGGNSYLMVGLDAGFCWRNANGSVGNGGNFGTVLACDAIGAMAQRNSTNAQIFRIYNTYTSTTKYERGKLEWSGNALNVGTEKGSGGGTARDMNLQTDGTTRATLSATGPLVLATDLYIGTAGKGLYIKEGSNATSGIVTLVGGTATVSTTKVTANSRIFLTVNGGTLTNVGSPYISARTAGTSFAITSTNASDASDVAWFIIEPA